MPAKPAWAAMQGTSRKKAARVCQSRSFRKVIIVGSKKSLLSLRSIFHIRGMNSTAPRILADMPHASSKFQARQFDECTQCQQCIILIQA